MTRLTKLSRMSLSWESVTPSTRSLSVMSLHSLNSVQLMGRTSGWKGLRGSLSSCLLRHAGDTSSQGPTRHGLLLSLAARLRFPLRLQPRFPSPPLREPRVEVWKGVYTDGPLDKIEWCQDTWCGPRSGGFVTEPADPRPVLFPAFNLARLKDVDGPSYAVDNVLERQVEAELVNQFHAVEEISTESEPV
eukprot:gene10402-21691_t